MSTIAERTFGIEFEVNAPTDVEIAPGGYHRGNAIPGIVEGWNAQADGSVRAHTGYRPVEIVSPVLSGEHGLAQVVGMIDQMLAAGFTVNDSCGIHVHVGCSDLDDAAIDRLIASYKAVEKALYGINGAAAADRWNNRFCRPSHTWEQGANALDRTNRYRGLNLANLVYRQKHTVEFRMLAGVTIDPAVIVGAIMLFVGLVQAAADGVTVESAGESPVAQVKTLTNVLYRENDYRIVDAPVADVLLGVRKNVKKAQL